MSEARSHDIAVAVRSAFVLGGSLMLTWSVALLVRLILPRTLGPDVFGSYNFADGLALTAFGFLNLGLDTYIQREISTRPEHASDFFGGITSIRVALTFMVFAVMAAVLRARGSGPEVWGAAFLFGVAQSFTQTGNSLAAMLQASRRVRGLAIGNVGSKVLWGVGTLVGLALHGDLRVLAFPMVLGEGTRVLVLFLQARKHLGLALRMDLASTKRTLFESLPFYANGIALSIYAKIDVSIMAFMANDHEVGLYGAAANFSSLAMLVAPLIGWVLMPLLSRAAARSPEELTEMLRRSLEGVLSLAIPVSLFMGVGADVWIRIAFGARFAASAPALAILSPMFILTYLAMLQATYLNLLGRGWTVTAVSLVGMCVNPMANVLLVPYCLRTFGEGGAGIGASIAMIVTEVVSIFAFYMYIGQLAFDRRNVKVITLQLGAALLVLPVHMALRFLGPGRLGVDALLYTVLVVVSGAVKPRDALVVVRTAIRNRGAVAATTT
ncbi:MAG TPA: flippase [Polyangiaceae bacterium]